MNIIQIKNVRNLSALLATYNIDEGGWKCCVYIHIFMYNLLVYTHLDEYKNIRTSRVLYIKFRNLTLFLKIAHLFWHLKRKSCFWIELSIFPNRKNSFHKNWCFSCGVFYIYKISVEVYVYFGFNVIYLYVVRKWTRIAFSVSDIFIPLSIKFAFLVHTLPSSKKFSSSHRKTFLHIRILILCTFTHLLLKQLVGMVCSLRRWKQHI